MIFFNVSLCLVISLYCFSCEKSVLFNDFKCLFIIFIIIIIFFILDQPNHVETNLLQPAPPLSLADQ